MLAELIRSGEYAREVFCYWLAFMAGAYVVFLVSQRLTDSGHEIELARGNFGREISLSQALLGFFSQPTALMFALLVVGMWSLRIYIANWSWLDLLVGGFVVVVWPLVEWIVHFFILHAR